MKRGQPLARRTPLVARTPLVSRSELKRTTPLTPGGPLGRNALTTRQPLKRTVRDTGPGRGVRALVAARDRGQCVRCGKRATSVHHRRNRGKGGTSSASTNCASNLVSTCGDGTTGCHGWIEHNRAAAEAAGWIVRHGVTSPADVPVQVHRHGLVHLTADGRYSPIGVAA